MAHPAATPLRVLFVCANDFREASAKQALWFGQELAARGHAVTLSVTGDADSARGELSVAGEKLRIRAHRFWGPRLASADVRAAVEFAPDVIHCWSSRLAAVAVARRLSAATGALVVVHWEDDEWRIRSDPMRRSLVRRLLRPAKRLVALCYPPLGVTMNEGSLRWLRANAAGLDALTPALAEHVSANTGLPCAVILPVTPTSGEAADGPKDSWPPQLDSTPVALWTGSVHPGLEADVRVAMRAVAEVQQRGHALAFVHVGDVLPRYDTASWATEAGLAPGTCRFLGYVPYPHVPGLLRRATVLLSSGAPNDYNRLRLPSKLQAYLVSGRPTITYATGFGELLRDREDAVLVHTAEPAELADRIVELLVDPGLRATLARGGPLAAARLFDPERNTHALVAYYREAIAGRPTVAGGRRGDPAPEAAAAASRASAG
jgi:glycosyltransferase involved in cell wall biosynthesis